MRCYVNENYQDWDAYVSILIIAYNSPVNCFKITHSFEQLLNRRIPDITLQSTLPTEKIPSTVEKPTGILATLHHFLNLPRALFRRTQ